MKKLIFISILLIVGCEELVAPDTTAPTVVITYPINESTLTETTTVIVDVADEGDIVSVKLLVDGIETYVDITAPYQFEWDVCVLGNGTHSVLVKAEDDSGNIGQSDLLTFTTNCIVGTYALTSYMVYDSSVCSGQGTNMMDDYGFDMTLYLNSNYTAIMTTTIEYDNEYDTETFSGSWYLNDNQVTITIEGDPITFTISENTLIYTESYVSYYYGYCDQIIFTKI